MFKRLPMIWILSLVMLLLSPIVAKAVTVSNASQLEAAISSAQSGGDKTIALSDGVYSLSQMLVVTTNGVTVYGASGNRDAVIIEGKGMSGSISHIFNVAGSNFTVRDVTLRNVANHAIQIHGENNADSPVIRNVHILDTGEQMVKVSYDDGNMSVGSDNGIMENCLLEYSAGIGPQYYIGGIDAHNAKNWIVRNNIFKGIRSPSSSQAEHAIHFWSDSKDTLSERNTIINCDRGIGYGLGDRGHSGGVIRNNMIYHDTSAGFADVAIGLENASGTQVYNNTIFMENSYPNAIEYRFSGTSGVLIVNNLTNKSIQARDGASGTVSDNVTGSQVAKSWFVNPAAGDLHLSSQVASVVDKGRTVSGLTTDFDGDVRPQGSGIDVGADEYASGSIPPNPPPAKPSNLRIR